MQRCVGHLARVLRVNDRCGLQFPVRQTATSALGTTDSRVLLSSWMHVPLSQQQFSISMTVLGDDDKASMEADQFLSHLEQGVQLDRLSDLDKATHRAHMTAIKAGEETYADPVTGYLVYTALSHLNRGHCCGNACRHCPYQHVNVEARYKNLKTFNSAFYS